VLRRPQHLDRALIGALVEKSVSDVAEERAESTRGHDCGMLANVSRVGLFVQRVRLVELSPQEELGALGSGQPRSVHSRHKGVSVSRIGPIFNDRWNPGS
jgi:hypothetical protein